MLLLREIQYDLTRILYPIPGPEREPESSSAPKNQPTTWPFHAAPSPGFPAKTCDSVSVSETTRVSEFFASYLARTEPALQGEFGV